MTYDASSQRAGAIGASYDGYVDQNPDPNDDDLATHNRKRSEERVMWMLRDVMANIAALRQDMAITSKGTVKVLTLGDSITVGYASQDGLGFRSFLPDLLKRQHIVPVMSTWSGPGWTIGNLQPGVAAALTASSPDIVLLNIGTNDASQGLLSTFQAAYGSLVDQILASSTTVKVVCARVATSRGSAGNNTLPNNEATINGYIDAVVSARTSGGRVASADMTPVPSQWTDNGIHPLDAGYLRMAQIYLAAMQAWLPA